MGAGSSKDGGPLAELTFSWVLKYADSALKYASSSSLVVIEKAGAKLLALAYQAAEAAHEGDRGQHLRFALSRDGGSTWSESKCVMWGAAPLWSPTLHYDAGGHRAGAAGQRLRQWRFRGGCALQPCTRLARQPQRRVTLQGGCAGSGDPHRVLHCKCMCLPIDA